MHDIRAKRAESICLPCRRNHPGTRPWVSDGLIQTLITIFKNNILREGNDVTFRPPLMALRLDLRLHDRYGVRKQTRLVFVAQGLTHH